MSRHYYFFQKLKIVQKQLGKLNCSYGKVSHTLKGRHQTLPTLPTFLFRTYKLSQKMRYRVEILGT